LKISICSIVKLPSEGYVLADSEVFQQQSGPKYQQSHLGIGGNSLASPWE